MFFKKNKKKFSTVFYGLPFEHFGIKMCVFDTGGSTINPIVAGIP